MLIYFIGFLKLKEILNIYKMTNSTITTNQSNEMGKSESMKKKIREIHNQDRGKI